VDSSRESYWSVRKVSIPKNWSKIRQPATGIMAAMMRFGFLPWRGGYALSPRFAIRPSLVFSQAPRQKEKGGGGDGLRAALQPVEHFQVGKQAKHVHDDGLQGDEREYNQQNLEEQWSPPKREDKAAQRPRHRESR
jgi:hypothetical protein